MSALVIDASAAASWMLPSQMTESADALALRIDEFELFAPYIFCWEIGNLLVRQAGRGLPIEFGRAVLDDLAIACLGAPTPSAVLGKVLEGAHGVGLSLFDSAYLALALDLDAPLVTRDARLIKAAELTGAPFIDLR